MRSPLAEEFCKVLKQKEIEVGGAKHRFSVLHLGPAGVVSPSQVLTLLARRSVREDPSILLATISVAADRDRRALLDMAARWDEPLPPIDCVVQPPLEGSDWVLSTWGLHGPSVSVDYPAPGLAVCRQPGLEWAAVGGLMGAAGTDTANAAHDCFLRLESQLRAGAFEPADLVKTWIYVDGIGLPDGDSTRYQALNRARRAFYDRVAFHRAGNGGAGPRFPASTGIGARAEEKTVVVAGIACRANGGVSFVPLENRAQTPAYEYPPRVSAYPPLFSRAMALVFEDGVLSYVSGTASIVGTESVFPQNVAAQTRQTLEHIDTLVAVENLDRAGIPVARGGLDTIAQCTVYVTRRGDLECVREICGAALPKDAPVTYVEADVCRRELLVEVEAMAYAPALGRARAGTARPRRQS